MKILDIIKRNYKIIIGVLLLGLIIGYAIGKSASQKNDKSTESSIENHDGHDHSAEDPTTWTCSMHPQIKQDKPGLCPICAMDLIPLASMQSAGDDMDPNEVVMTESAAKLADIQTMTVAMGTPQNSIFLQGKVQADERNISKLTARFGGRVEKLFVNFTGQDVRKGQKLATIYSPDLVTAQRELIEAATFKDTRPSLYHSAKAKLKLWDLTDEQISAIEEKSEPQVNFEILSPITGTVTMRHVALGDYVKEGSTLFEVTDLSKVWVLFDAYERDLPWIKTNDSVNFTIQAIPGRNFNAKVTFIDPFINGQTRVAKVRVELSNNNHELKPEMFANGIIKSQRAEKGREILIPKSAVLWTGKRSVVYVKVPDRDTPSFIYREIVLGPEAGTFYVVSEGLEEGEEIAVNGVFKIDASAQLNGLTSMMNPEGGRISTGHDHGAGGMSSSGSGEHTAFMVGGNCGMCKDRIEEAALSVDGVTSANWESETQMLHLNYDKGVSLDKVHHAVGQSGHDTEKEQAPDDVYEALPGCCLYERFAYDQGTNTESQHAMFTVAGNCGMCKTRIEEAAGELDGVIMVNWDSENDMLHLEYDPQKVTVDDVEKAIAAVGHDTENYNAPDDVYEALHECCLYERLHK